ncbi:hypothetical protein C1645_759475 [Glomus cerebriforme]|uniref:Uncharacterized protein n=1 Tax=Glomus cerebriforme TaxID=658196 RepID=A0A397TIR0_9GLOM|nr:hypothetical protein C1645_759475 [Glomus cerebriforme]
MNQPRQQNHHLHRRGPWLRHEDDQLIALVGRYGNDWIQIENLILTRTAQDCMRRYAQLRFSKYNKLFPI